jgi:hypothetical protein
MPFRNVDGSSEIVESKGAHLDSRILFVNRCKRQRGYSEDTSPASNTIRSRRAADNYKDWIVSSLLSALILFSTVTFAVTLGVATSYATVIGILHAFASQRREPLQPVLVQNQARAAHAGGD